MFLNEVTTIGRVARLRRYPVKSMGGEELARASVEPYGFSGDRIYAYVVDDAPNPRFPWMTARQASEMLLYKPKFVQSGEVEVFSPDGKKYSMTDAGLERHLEKKYGYAISLKYSESGWHDASPVSIMGLQSLTRLSQEAGIIDLAPERFRANIYADWENGEPFFEDSLVGKAIKIGDSGVTLKIVRKDSRCVIPTSDPETGRALPKVLETIQSSHAGCIGVYADVVCGGTIVRADDIYLV